jgi:hypothetical protein
VSYAADARGADAEKTGPESVRIVNRCRTQCVGEIRWLHMTKVREDNLNVSRLRRIGLRPCVSRSSQPLSRRHGWLHLFPLAAVRLPTQSGKQRPHPSVDIGIVHIDRPRVSRMARLTCAAKDLRVRVDADPAQSNLAGLQRESARSQQDGFECKNAERYASVAGDHWCAQSSLVGGGERSVHSIGTLSAAAWTSTHSRASSRQAQLPVAGARRDAVGMDTNAAVSAGSPLLGSIQASSPMSCTAHSPATSRSSLDVERIGA